VHLGNSDLEDIFMFNTNLGNVRLHDKRFENRKRKERNLLAIE
jgi:hypothetical protein